MAVMNSTNPVNGVGHFSSPHSDILDLACRRQRLGVKSGFLFCQADKMKPENDKGFGITEFKLGKEGNKELRDSEIIVE